MLLGLIFVKHIALDEFVFHDSESAPEISEKKSYIETVDNLISDIKNGMFDKVVFSRVIKSQISKSPSLIYEDLCNAYPSAFVYLISIENYGTWLGASPESFIDIEGLTLKTTALAGTKTDPNHPWGEKEINEQEIVSDFIEKELKAANTSFIRKSEPYTLFTGSVYHIKTDFSCRVEQNEISAIINNLHPTPATCGIPKLKAKNKIPEIEVHDRLFYTGFLGPTAKGSSQLFVNLRCMQIIGNTAFMYVGGGITADSIADDEWQETINKSNTLLKYLT